jgi:hypothetical protein
LFEFGRNFYGVNFGVWADAVRAVDAPTARAVRRRRNNKPTALGPVPGAQEPCADSALGPVPGGQPQEPCADSAPSRRAGSRRMAMARTRRPDTRRGRNLLAAALLGSEADVVRLIDTNMDLDARGDWYETGAVRPRYHGRIARPFHGGTAMLWAVLGDHPAIVHALVTAGAQVNARDSMGRTALHYAVLLGDMDLAGFLLAHGASIDARDKRSNTALSEAWNIGLGDMARMLLDNMAEYQEPCAVSLILERRRTAAERLTGVLPLMTLTAQAARRVRPHRVGPQLIDLHRHLRLHEMLLAEPARREALRVVDCEAFAMGHQERLGAQSRVRGLDAGVVRMVLEYVLR